MTQTLEEANKAMRRAVRERLDATEPEDKQGPLAGCKPAEEAAAKVLADAWQGGCCEGKRRPAKPAQSVAWIDAVNRLTQLHREKTAQYGGDRDPFENVTASAKCGVEPWRRALCDLSDCVVRMQKYAQGQPVDWKNALMDAANWALICLIKLEEEHRAASDRR